MARDRPGGPKTVTEGEPEEFRLPDRRGQLRVGEPWSQIRQGAPRLGHGYAVAESALAGGEGRGSMKGDAALPLATPVARDGDVDGWQALAPATRV
jgi:hypothetical protein